jgi:hypothetical protein
MKLEEIRVLTKDPQKADGYWMVSYSPIDWYKAHKEFALYQISATKEQCPEIESLKEGNVVAVIKNGHENVKGLKFLKDCLTLMRTEAEINTKITELENADLDAMVTDEVEYGLFWLKWVLGQEEHTTKMRKP